MDEKEKDKFAYLKERYIQEINDLYWKIDEINTDKGKLKVLLSLFGQETPVELDFLQIEKL